MHTIPKNYQCKSCSESFSEAELLKKHIHAIHEGQKENKCEFCGKLFARAHGLKQHIRTIHEAIC